ncbi:MAG: mechanosensitive ion channel [Ketobacteraceae bacterium]|nr:mechanosensitive ion channel [Ketobacteraceae bacterium]
MFDEWQERVVQPIQATLGELLGYFPNLLYALLTLAAGWLVATGFKKFFVRIGQASLARSHSNTHRKYGLHALNALPKLIGLLGFWIVILFTLAATLQALGIDILPLLARQFGAYIPNIIVSLAILFATYAFAKLAREFANRSAMLSQLDNSQPAIAVAQLVIWAIGLLMVADQLGVRSTVLLILFGVLSTALFGAFAISFGLGARIIADNILSTRYAQKSYRIGDVIEINKIRGTISEITPTSVVLVNDQGTHHIPGALFSRETVLVVESQ